MRQKIINKLGKCQMNTENLITDNCFCFHYSDRLFNLYDFDEKKKQAAEKIKTWLTQIPILIPIILLSKKILRLSLLGISTYTMFHLVFHFLKKYCKDNNILLSIDKVSNCDLSLLKNNREMIILSFL